MPGAVQGMNLLDFFYLRDELLPADKALPTPKNSILHDQKETGVAKFSSAADIDWLDSYLTKIQDEPIVYLGASQSEYVSLLPVLAGSVVPTPTVLKIRMQHLNTLLRQLQVCSTSLMLCPCFRVL